MQGKSLVTVLVEALETWADALGTEGTQAQMKAVFTLAAAKLKEQERTIEELESKLKSK